jgi:ankyrin repeat protein
MGASQSGSRVSPRKAGSDHHVHFKKLPRKPVSGMNESAASLAMEHCSNALRAAAQGEVDVQSLQCLQALLETATGAASPPATLTLQELKHELNWDTQSTGSDTMMDSQGAMEDSVGEWLASVLGAQADDSSSSAKLCDAAAHGDVGTLRNLVKMGVSVNLSDYDKRTATHLAASEGLLEVVKVLVNELGADPSPCDRWGNTPLDDALRSRHHETAEFLEKKGGQRGRATTNIAAAAAVDRSATELCDAAASGDIEGLKRLVREHGIAPDLGDYDRRTALHLASSEGLLDVVKVLVEELGADLSVTDRWQNTPLDDAVRSSHASVIDYLQSRGGKRGVASSDVAGAADPSADLCDAAARGDVERLRALVKGGLDVNRGDYDRRTALHLAASEGLVETIRVLVDELGAECGVVDRWGHTPLDDAIRTHREQASVLLRSRGAARGERGGFHSQPMMAWSSPDTAVGDVSLWVMPKEMDLVFSSELFAPMALGEHAQKMAAAALEGFDGDVIALDEASGGHALYLVGHTLLTHHGLYDALGLDRATCRRFLLALEATYGVGAYHNSKHGADVALSLHVFLSQFQLVGRLTKLELFAAILGALCHDFNHPGTNNSHEQRVRTQRSLRHSDASILERHHLHSTFTLMQHPPLDILARLSSEDRASVRSLMIDAVLATDLSQHLPYVTRLRALAASRGHAMHAVHGRHDVPWESPFLDPAEVDVKLLLAVGLKWADVSHSTKAQRLHLAWTHRVSQEFWALGDAERAMGIPLSPLCDREKDGNVAKSQLGFFKYICIPFYSVVADLVAPDMLPWVRVKENLVSWERRAKAAKGRE